MSSIEWVHDGRRIILPILLLTPTAANDQKSMEAQALVDTGATSSGITSRAVKRLGLVSHGKRPLTSAHGDGHADRYIFRIGLHVEQTLFVFEEIDGFGLNDSFHLDALLGMDILRQCDFSIDRRGKCVLHFGRM